MTLRPPLDPMTSTDPPSASEAAGLPVEAAALLRAWAAAATGTVELHHMEDVHRAFTETDASIWVDLIEPTASLLSDLTRSLDLHPLIVEDILERNQRAKIELTGPHLHLVLFAMEYQTGLSVEEIDIVLGERFLLTAHPAAWDPTATPSLRYGIDRYLREGPDYLLWALLDGVVDAYFPVYDQLSDRIDDLQEEVLRGAGSRIVQQLFDLRRELLAIRHVVTPQREILNQLTNRDLPVIKRAHSVYFRDVYDHMIRLADELDTYRELVSTTLDAYLSTVNNNLSEIMKRLTSITAVLASVGALAGIFGMSEAGLALSFGDLRFWFLTGVIALVAGVGLLYFRRIGWL